MKLKPLTRAEWDLLRIATNRAWALNLEREMGIHEMAKRILADVLPLLKSKKRQERFLEAWFDDFLPSNRRKMLVKLGPKFARAVYTFDTELALICGRRFQQLRASQPQKADENNSTATKFLSENPLRRGILSALNADDRSFFINLGKALDKPKKERPRERTQDLENFLFAYWVDPGKNFDPLATMTRSKLCQICRQELKDPTLTEDSIRQKRKALGLLSVSEYFR